mgnify:CR=1 FL=1
MAVMKILLFLLAKLNVSLGQCDYVMYNNEKFEIVDQAPGFDSCKGKAPKSESKFFKIRFYYNSTLVFFRNRNI